MTVARMSLGEIASLVAGELQGDPAVRLERISPIHDAGPGSITFISNRKYYGALSTTRATAVLCPRDLDVSARPEGTAAIVVDNPYLAFAKLMQKWHEPGPRSFVGVDPRAVVEPGAVVEEGATVHAFAFVGEGAVVGGGSCVHPFVYVGARARVGRGCTLYPSAVLYPGVTLGDRVTLHAHAVIGADGFGYATDWSRFEHVKIPQVGTVVIEDDVEIGAGSTVDRAVLGETRIGAGTKIDNLVMVAHNVRTGMGCFLVAQSGVSGSTKLGNFVTLAGQAGLVGHIDVGDGAVVGAQAGITNSVPPGGRMLGSPAIDGRIARRYMATLPHLPEIKRGQEDLEERVRVLEARLGVTPAPRRTRRRERRPAGE